MKILILNPELLPEDQLLAKLISLNFGVLQATKADFALQLIEFHARSLNILLVHRELEGKKSSEEGLKFIQKIKKIPELSKIPIILTSRFWDEPDFIKHQNSANKLNAYLKWPFEPEVLLKTLEAVLKVPLGTHGKPPLPPTSGRSIPPPIPPPSTRKNPARMPKPPSAQIPKEYQLTSTIKLEEAPALESSISFDQQDFEISLSAPQHIANMIFDQDKQPIEQPAPPPISMEFSSADMTSSPNDLISPQYGTLQKTEARETELPIMPTSDSSSSELTMEIPLLNASFSVPSSSLNLGDVGENKDVQNIPQKPANAIPIEVSSLFNSDIAQGAETVAVQLPLEFNLDPSEAAPLKIELDEKKESQPLEEAQLAQNLPYLFGQKKNLSSEIFSVPVGDAVIPGGTTQVPDLETLKKYLSLREQDVAVLSVQLKLAQDQLQALQDELNKEKSQSEFQHQSIKDLKEKINNYGLKENIAAQGAKKENQDMHFQLRSKDDKIRFLEAQIKQSEEETERLKERVRIDIRKIMVHEKELENRLEILKKDSEALLITREEKIVELKRKLDLLEFNMDLLQNKLSKEKETTSQLREKMGKATQAIRVANGMLDLQDSMGTDNKKEAS